MSAKARSAVVAEVKIVTRAEVTAEREAARQRRELAQEVTGEDRALVLPLVEADRREQLGRTQAAAERRIERRQGLMIGGELKEKLLTQARALRKRLGRELTQVKEWVRERVPEPVQQLKAQARGLFGVAEKTPAGTPAKKSVAEIQAEARERWLAHQKLALSKEDPNPAHRAREKWLEYRRQQLLKSVQKKESDQEAKPDRDKKCDRGIDDDYGL